MTLPGRRANRRPRGVIRVALYESAVRLADEKGGAPWREIAAAATLRVAVVNGGEMEQRGVSADLARQTIKDMVRAGELFEVGREKPEGTSHWRAIYAPALAEYGFSGAAFEELEATAAAAEVLQGWGRGA